MLERVIYVSRARDDVDRRAAYEIIRVSHNRNSRLGLTGVLLLIDGWFLQVLEGERHAVDGRLHAIGADPRHRRMVVRDRRAISTPAFPGEWMALSLAEDVPTTLRERFGYRPGFPAEQFDAQQLLAFAQSCQAVTLAR